MLLAIAGFDFIAPNATGNNYFDVGTVGRDTNIKRTGTASADIGFGTLGKIFASHPVTIIVGWGHYLTGLNARLLVLSDGSTDHLSITVDSNGTLRVRRGGGSGTILGSSDAGLIPLNAWFYLEVKATINGSTGSVEVRFNGITKITLTNVNTANSANLYVDRVMWQSGKVDDLYVCDTTGPDNYDYLGDIKVETILPNAAGDASDLTPSAGSNYQNVDDSPSPNDDTDYNESANVGDRDLYHLSDLATASGSIKGVMITARMRKTDAGAREAAIIHKSGSTETEEGSVALGTSYVNYQSSIHETNPDTGNAWTIAEVNALQAGLKVKS